MGWALAGVGACSAVVQAGLVGRVVARVGDRRAILTGLACGALGFAAYGLAPTGRLFLLGMPIMSLWGLYGPAAQGLMTRRVSRSEQGALQGALSSIQMITGLVGPVLFSETFAASIGRTARWHLPGAAFLLASLLLAVGVVVAQQATKPAPPPVPA